MPALLELRAVSKRFGGLQALREVTFGIEAGTLVALLGPNGAGKTTLFDIVTGLARPTSGMVRFDGIDLGRVASHRIAALGIGRTFQIARLFPALPAVDNVLVGVTFGRRRLAAGERRARAARLLEMVGLEAKAMRPARELSLGEQKRLELAVALGPEPRLLLLDELASGLPPRGREEVVRFYSRLRGGGLTILAIEHSPGRLAELADRVLVLDQGALVADGRPREVLASRRVAEAYLGEDD
ncbi:MAG TPA: ATP-binding cassette domain-containing protein [Methylomirabilota bacterium]|jgi:branched-chain amino acid transport system ATP-binding protein|nr:ATP-binding cassette domain-containing protein [Methylomirabilota bacterium]